MHHLKDTGYNMAFYEYTVKRNQEGTCFNLTITYFGLRS